MHDGSGTTPSCQITPAGGQNDTTFYNQELAVLLICVALATKLAKHCLNYVVCYSCPDPHPLSLRGMPSAALAPLA